MIYKQFKPLFNLFSPFSLFSFSIMDRYLAMQLISPFLFGVGAFISVV